VEAAFNLPPQRLGRLFAVIADVKARSVEPLSRKKPKPSIESVYLIEIQQYPKSGVPKPVRTRMQSLVDHAADIKGRSVPHAATAGATDTSRVVLR
jgi:hypothetical protein